MPSYPLRQQVSSRCHYKPYSCEVSGRPSYALQCRSWGSWIVLPSCVPYLLDQPACDRSRLSRSNSPQRFIVIFELSNSPSYSIPASFVFSPAVFRVSPHEKSSNFQNAYIGSTRFHTGREMRYMNIQRRYDHRCPVIITSTPGRPRIRPRSTSGITWTGLRTIEIITVLSVRR